MYKLFVAVFHSWNNRSGLFLNLTKMLNLLNVLEIHCVKFIKIKFEAVNKHHRIFH